MNTRYEWCLPPEPLASARYPLISDDFDGQGMIGIETTYGWLVLVRHFESPTGTTYSEYVRPSELRQKP